jgi:fluoride exporter
MGEGGWMVWAGVALGSALGGVLRYGVIDAVTAVADPRFPWGTLVVNVSGSLAIGVIAAIASPDSRIALSPALRHTLMGGVLGGFTTFSSFSLQTLVLVQTGEMGAGLLNVLGSVVLCIAACAAGWSAGLWWLR